MPWIESARKVKAESQWQWVDTETGHLCSKGNKRRTMLDGTTANMLVSVHDALNPANQARFAALPILKAVTVGWKCLKAAS